MSEAAAAAGQESCSRGALKLQRDGEGQVPWALGREGAVRVWSGPAETESTGIWPCLGGGLEPSLPPYSLALKPYLFRLALGPPQENREGALR